MVMKRDVDQPSSYNRRRERKAVMQRENSEWTKREGTKDRLQRDLWRGKQKERENCFSWTVRSIIGFSNPEGHRGKMGN